MRRIRGFIASLVVLSSLVSTAAEAKPVQFVLNLETVAFQEPCTTSLPNTIFGCASPGDKFFGSFGVPDAALLTDGVKDGIVSGFTLDLGLVHYRPGGGTGYRGSTGRFDSTIGVSIVGGKVDSLLGGVYSLARDQPYVDFFLDASSLRFEAVDQLGDYLRGTVTITQVPEPALLLLVGLGAACGVASRRRRKPGRGH